MNRSWCTSSASSGPVGGELVIPSEIGAFRVRLEVGGVLEQDGEKRVIFVKLIAPASCQLNLTVAYGTLSCDLTSVKHAI